MTGSPSMRRLPLLPLLLLALMPTAARADVAVAVAANFTEPAKAIAAAFQRATGQRTALSFGSSGAFAVQVAHGAPFELFLSADTERPAALERQGLTVPGTRFPYAIGRLALWSARPGLVDAAGAVLRRGDFTHLAIADPAAAPYGLAATQAMARLGVADALAPKLVKGASITQAYQFVATGAAELGFVAWSQVVAAPGGSHWLVPAGLHRPIVQEAVLLRPGAGDPAARALWRFLRGPQAAAIIRRYGYEAPAAAR